MYDKITLSAWVYWYAVATIVFLTATNLWLFIKKG